MAADSRQTVAGVVCDGRRKLIQPRRLERTIVTVTGQGQFIPAPPSGVAVTEEYVREAPRLLDISARVCAYLEEQAAPVARLELTNVAEHCTHALDTYQKEPLGALRDLVGQEVFRVVLAGYEPENSMAVVRTFTVSWDGERATFMTSPDKHFDGDSAFGLHAYGETAYLDREVYGGVGRRFLTKPTIDLVLKPRPIAEVTIDEAVSAAKNVIGAASNTTKIVPSPTGIGGPVDVLLLSEEPRPRSFS